MWQKYHLGVCMSSSNGIVMLEDGYTSMRNGSDEDEVQNKNVELSKVTCNSLLNIWDCDVYKQKTT